MSFREHELTVDKVILPIGVEVPWGEWRQATSPTALFTTGIRECIAVATFDPIKRVGHMAHILANTPSQEDLLPTFVESIVDKCDGQTSRLEVCISGGRADEDSLRHFSAALGRRSAVVRTFTELGIPDPWHIAWDEEYLPQNLQLDCSTGDFSLTRVRPIPRWTQNPATDKDA